MITTAMVENKIRAHKDAIEKLINRAVIVIGIKSKTIVVPKGPYAGEWHVKVTNKEICAQRWIADDKAMAGGHWETCLVDFPGVKNDVTGSINVCLPERHWNRLLDTDSLAEVKRFMEVEQREMAIAEACIDASVDSDVEAFFR